MSGGELSWMIGYQAKPVVRPARRHMSVGISEVFFGENGRQLSFLQDSAQLIEEIGYDYMWFPEHVVFFESFESK